MNEERRKVQISNTKLSASILRWMGIFFIAILIAGAGIALTSSDGWAPCNTTIGDFVWNDVNGNGIQDDGEPGIEGVSVILKNEYGNQIYEDITGANGYYEFKGNCPGEYTIEVDETTLPNNFVPSPCNVGSNDSVDNDCSPVTITLGDNEINKTIDFGYWQPESALGDRVWHDLNGNGIQDANEPGIAYVTVDLVNCDTGEVLDTAETNADGFYLFEDLDAGQYCVQFNLNTVPAGTCDFGSPQFTAQNAGGDDAVDSDVDSTGLSQAVILGEDETNLSVDAGIVCPGPASLGDRVWQDLNGNGTQDCEDTNGNGIIGDAGDTGAECQDAGISGVTVDLLNCDTGELLDTTFTDAEGFYLFDNLTPGEYCVQFDLDTVPADVCEFGFPQFTTPNAGDDEAADSDANPATGITPGIFLGEGETNLTVDAGIVCPGPASLGDRMWKDINGNGIQDCEDTNNNGIIGDAGDIGVECQDAGVSGVTVDLVNCETGALLDTTFTNADGFYLFEDLDEGQYCVQFNLSTVPAGTCDFGSPQFTVQNADGDDAVDSDADPTTGVTEPVTLSEGETNRTVDAGIVCPGPASLGDRVWQDLNGNGIQDCTDTNGNGILGDVDENGIADEGVECQAAGIPGVTVELVNCDTGAVLDTTLTDADGFYLFEDLIPGEYCVQFNLNTVPTGTCDFGSPQFTTQNAEDDDAVDSDADSTGRTPGVILGEGETNLTVDAGIVCPGPASLGDRVWEDLNGNGIQDCEDTNNNGIIGDADDTGAECQAAGIPDVTVELVDCDNSGLVLASTTTDADGFYLFDNLIPGEYCVKFDLGTVPPGTCDFGSPQFTTPNADGDDALDSDADPTTGVTSPIALGEGETNLTVDAGIVCQECNITIDKKCLVAPPALGPFECDGKVDQLKMIWNGPGELASVNALPGGSESFPEVTITEEAGVQVVTVAGYQPSTNDVIWQWVSTEDSGESKFHLSCSDDEMDGPEDCGMPQGNGKSNEDEYDNIWLLDGLATDEGFVLDCTPQPAEPTDRCEFETLPPPDCENLGKPTSLTFRYTGADCSVSNNSQGDKSDCIGEPGSAPISITILKDTSKITVSPDNGIEEGDLVTVSAIGSDMGSVIELYVGGQFLEIHTSCSAPLAVDDVFGSLELVQFNGQGSGAEVTYFYEVTNIGNSNVALTSVFDDQLGELLEMPPVSLVSGDSFTLEKTAFISETTTNEVTATAAFPGDDLPCGEAVDEVTVTVTEPTCEAAIVLDKLEDDKIKWEITNTSKIVATLETLTVNFPPEYGLIKEVKLDGGIFKKGDSSLYPDGVPSGSTIGENDWTEVDVSKRQLDPGETRTLEVAFTDKSDGEGWVDVDLAGTATFTETCAVWLIKPSGCEIGKPTALVFQYTGEDCTATTNLQDGKFKCEQTGALGALAGVVMTKDSDKITAEISGDLVTIFYSDPVGKEFPSEIKYEITGTSGDKQSQTLHTSCSQPLSLGDQFGSLILRQFYPKL